MSNTKQNALDFLASNADTKEVYATTDGYLFLKKSEATEHARDIDCENVSVETFSPEKKLEKPTEVEQIKNINPDA